MDANTLNYIGGLGLILLVAYLWVWCNNKKAAIWALVGAAVGWGAAQLFL